VQVKEKHKVGRPDIDAFEMALRRAKCEKGFLRELRLHSDALREIDRFSSARSTASVVPLAVRE